jgi:hypothetical protein
MLLYNKTQNIRRDLKVTSQKFGLVELEKLTQELRCGNTEIRTVKVVLAVTGIPNTIAQEAQDVINRRKADCDTLQKTVANTLVADKKHEEETKRNIAQIKRARQTAKESHANTVTAALHQHTAHTSEIATLEKILAKFA